MGFANYQQPKAAVGPLTMIDDTRGISQAFFSSSPQLIEMEPGRAKSLDAGLLCSFPTRPLPPMHPTPFSAGLPSRSSCLPGRQLQPADPASKTRLNRGEEHFSGRRGGEPGPDHARRRIRKEKKKKVVSIPHLHFFVVFLPHTTNLDCIIGRCRRKKKKEITGN
jgi:hypothetical protein